MRLRFFPGGLNHRNLHQLQWKALASNSFRAVRTSKKTVYFYLSTLTKRNIAFKSRKKINYCGNICGCFVFLPDITECYTMIRALWLPLLQNIAAKNHFPRHKTTLRFF